MPPSLILLFSLLLWAPADPGFGGCWRLNPAESEAAGLRSSPPHLIRIEHSGKTVRLIDVQSKDDPGWVFTTDGKETRAKNGGATLNSIAKWEGAALLINTLVNSASSGYTQMDRWRVSRDGTRFTVRREIVGPRGNTRSLLVYARCECPGPR